MKFYKYILVLFLTIFSSHAFAENVLISKNWLTQCEHDVFEGTSECFVLNHKKSLNSERMLLIERGEEKNWAIVVLLNEEVDNDFYRAAEVSIKIDKNEPHFQEGWLSYRNEKYAQAGATFDNTQTIISQMKKGSFISIKVAMPVHDFEVLDKFSLAGFTKTLNKALALDKRRPDGGMDAETKAYYEARAKQVNDEVEAADDMDAETKAYYEARAGQVNDQVEAGLSQGLMSAMAIDKKTNERVGDSGAAIRAFIDQGLLGKKPKERLDYTDYWVLNNPVTFMGHQLVVIEEEYMTKYIGCCVSPGIGITVKVESDVSELKMFANNNKCSVDIYDLDSLNKSMSSLGTVAKSEGEYLTLSCRERDANK